jgi:hypothetical protein
VRDSYYSLSEERVTNFTALVTNSSIEKFAEDAWNNPEIFPLQMIWFSPNRLFLSRQGVPSLPEEDNKEFEQKIIELNQQLKKVIPNLLRFIYKGIYNSLSEDYLLQTDDSSSTVIIKYIQGAGSLEIITRYYFSFNGLCTKIETNGSSDKKDIIIYPIFRTVKTKWLCSGWKIKTIGNREDTTEYTVSLRNKIINDLWAPTDIQIDLKKPGESSEVFLQKIKIRNYLFNQPIEFINKPKKGD